MWAIQYHRYGDPSVLRCEEIPVPVPRGGEALIETVASGVSAIDLMYRAGELRVHGVGFPKQPGFDALGIVRESRIPGIAPGRWVWAVLGLEPSRRRGTAVELLCVDASRIGAFPSGYEPAAEVGSLPLGALTALKALGAGGRVSPGHRVLVVGAAGAVGIAAVQLARFFGAGVDAVAGSAGLDVCRALGAERVFDHASEVVSTARRARAYDAVIVAGGRGKDWLDAVGAGGRLVLARADGWIATLPAAIRRGRRVYGVAAGHGAAELGWLAERVARGDLLPVVGRTYDVRDLADAHRELGSGGTAGARLIRHGAVGPALL